MIAAPVASASCVTSSPPTTSDSLFASARSIPSPSAATVGTSPAEPTIALRTRSHSVVVISRTSASWPAQHLAVRPRLGGARGGVLVGERDPPDAVRGRLLDQRLPGVGRAQRDDLELVRARHDVERLDADRAGRAEDHEAAGHAAQSSGAATTRARDRLAHDRLCRDSDGPALGEPQRPELTSDTFTRSGPAAEREPDPRAARLVRRRLADGDPARPALIDRDRPPCAARRARGCARSCGSCRR